MRKRSSPYPRVRIESGGHGVVSQAGGVLLIETARKSGLDTAISAAFVPWRRPRAVHDPGKILWDVALALALGGDCPADVSMLRAEPAVFGPVASDPTVSRLVDKLAAAGPKARDAIRTARADATRVPRETGPEAGAGQGRSRNRGPGRRAGRHTREAGLGHLEEDLRAPSVDGLRRSRTWRHRGSRWPPCCGRGRQAPTPPPATSPPPGSPWPRFPSSIGAAGVHTDPH